MKGTMRGLGGTGRTGCRRQMKSAVVLAALCALMIPSVATAAKPPPPVTKTYLALGDSYAFGFSTQLYNEGLPGDPAQGFASGYVDDYFKTIPAAERKATQLTNDACPFETTESFIGKNTTILEKLNSTLKAKQEEKELPPVTGTETEPKAHTYANCEYQEDSAKVKGMGGPLHHSYPGESQLENAIKTIKEDAEKGTPVTTITLDISYFDMQHAIQQAEAEARKKIEEEVLPIVLLKEPEFAQQVAEAAKVRVEEYLKKERPNLVTECADEVLQKLLELKITAGEVPAFELKCIEAARLEAAAKDEGEHPPQKEVEELLAAGAAKYVSEHNYELNNKGEAGASETLKAEVPSLVAQIRSNLIGILTAIREAHSVGLGGIDYAGKIIFQNSYSPYGKLFQYAIEGKEFTEAHGGQEGPYSIDNGRCEVHSETQQGEEKAIAEHCLAATLRIGWNTIVGLVNNWTYVAAQGEFRACDVDPEQQFDPANAKKPTLEPERLQSWTNMTNTHEANGRLDGPDIDPTPVGYKQLSSEMVKEAKACHKQVLQNPSKGPLGF